MGRTDWKGKGECHPEKAAGMSKPAWSKRTAMLEWSPGFDGGHADTCIIVPPVAPEVEADYQLGVQGTETRLVYELTRAGFDVSNPCKVLVSHHEHKSGYRTYDPTDAVNGDGREQPVPEPAENLPRSGVPPGPTTRGGPFQSPSNVHIVH